MKKTYHFSLLLLLFVILSSCQVNTSLKKVELVEGSVSSYVECSVFDLEAIELSLIYNNRTEKINVSPSMLSEGDLAKLQNPGKHALTITYLGFSVPLTVYLYGAPIVEPAFNTVFCLTTTSKDSALLSISGSKGLSSCQFRILFDASNVLSVSLNTIISDDEILFDYVISNGYITFVLTSPFNLNNIDLFEINYQLVDQVEVFDQFEVDRDFYKKFYYLVDSTVTEENDVKFYFTNR